MHQDIIDLINTKKELDVSILFQIKVSLGASDQYYRHVIDNFPVITNDGSATWTPWNINTQEFIYRLNESTQPTEVTLHDPEDSSLPGIFKTLLQYEKILNRASFSLWVVFKDVSPNITQQTSNIVGNTLSFSSTHGLGIFDRIEVDTGSGIFEEFTIVGVSGNDITVENPNSISFGSTVTTVRKPYYKDSTTWHKKIEGKLRGASFTEGITVLKLGQESDLLGFEVPNVTYSFQCPYTTGDSNCRLYDSEMANSAIYNVLTASGNTVVVSGPVSTTPAGKTIPPVAATDQAYWTLGSLVVQTGTLQGLVRTIRESVYNEVSGHYTLTVDREFSGSHLGGTVLLQANCNRSSDDCKNRFVNENNFGGLETIVRSVGGINVPRQVSTE